MEAGILFVEFMALACVVEISFKIANKVRSVRRGRRPQAAQMAASSETLAGRNDWYCFFKPSTFRRHKSARRTAPAARPRSDARPRARMAFK